MCSNAGCCLDCLKTGGTMTLVVRPHFVAAFRNLQNYAVGFAGCGGV
jgi:hypothetical protein